MHITKYEVGKLTIGGWMVTFGTATRVLPIGQGPVQQSPHCSK